MKTDKSQTVVNLDGDAIHLCSNYFMIGDTITNGKKSNTVKEILMGSRGSIQNGYYIYSFTKPLEFHIGDILYRKDE
jgi:hypothetical protein